MHQKNKTFRKPYFLLILILFFSSSNLIAQEKDSNDVSNDSIRLSTDAFSQIIIEDYDPLGPSKAAFYSAVFPGLGQAYNKKYWKVPIVWGALATSTYFYVDNNNQYKRYRTAYKERLLGRQDEFTTDSGQQLISDAGLERAQEVTKRNSELSLLITVGLYVLQIIEASTNAHLMQFNMDKSLSFKPQFTMDAISGEIITGASLTFNFN